MPEPRAGRRRSRKVDGDARQLILDAAEKLFAAQGFDATPTAAIAAAAGVPKGLVFYYFPTKEAILTALMTERVPARPIEDIAAVIAPGDPATSLVNLDAALNLRDHHSSVLRVIMWREADTHPDVRKQLRSMRDQLLDVTARVLQASAPGPVKPGTLRACAAAWVSAMFAIASTDRLHALDGMTLPTAEEVLNVAQVVAAGMTQLG
ncbi:TetR/AcrR family transcriptional regulator [Nocardia otitidiscaviarum]|uniref:Fatty acid metabolism regulator protein n=1 Tax=Nocardia otitidiscaviarum TaxID=1823 RepID=A0A378Y8I9_9NOCA|nr:MULTISPECIES: TetR/AcrR family transcriptional regulator [Nocardia]MBF6137861.1 TetR/AcrR family transcriptional regulator [Nocardia otitidiscaviarum]MBF6183121.1 TetR/AcrR family transcriptional regulator [Nocardia otitidiscaviarum]MBF6488757.1 TetR/AcrR family transcriptional regulator [Nocardia otitidiscaviarum]MCP9622728.1 TetR/AcrR family transcriptional regulator [Nocardia otitidiscaviarum]QDP77466.1 TetR/AcrR family transcriptional regulator [Nocardia otitidiscaviarum]